MSLLPEPFSLEIFSDASLVGWGAACQGMRARGSWTPAERELHINELELLATLFALKSFTKGLPNSNILLRIDNTTAISYINRMGGIKFPHLSAVAFQIWQYCKNKNLYVFASYINSKDNCTADEESQKLKPETEYELSQEAFEKVSSQLGRPEIDIFASRKNAKCARYFSWKCDPGSEVVDAFTVPWTNKKFYAFPPSQLF